MSDLATPINAWCPSIDDAGDGTTTLTDFGPASNNGAITNGTWEASDGYEGGRCLRFAGTGDVATSAVGVSGSAARTYVIWFRTTSSGYQSLISYGSEAAYQRIDFRLQLGNQILLGSNAANIKGTAGASFTDDAWHSAIFTYSGGALSSGTKIYLDGASLSLSGVNTHTSLNTGTANGVHMARFYDGSLLPLTGCIDGIRIYDFVATPSQVTELHNGGPAYLLGSTPAIAAPASTRLRTNLPTSLGVNL